MRTQLRLYILMMLMLTAFPAVQPKLFAQGTASISGTTTDSTRAGVPNAGVVLTNSETNQARQAVSSSEGYFEFTDLTPGHYTVKVEREGFKTWLQTSITLEVAQHITVYPQLAVGSVSEHVEVTTEPAAITTSNSDISQVVSSEQIEQLPLYGRNALQLVSLFPGVVHANLSNPTTTLTSANFGKITTATSPRVVEFGIRMTY